MTQMKYKVKPNSNTDAAMWVVGPEELKDHGFQIILKRDRNLFKSNSALNVLVCSDSYDVELTDKVRRQPLSPVNISADGRSIDDIKFYVSQMTDIPDLSDEQRVTLLEVKKDIQNTPNPDPDFMKVIFDFVVAFHDNAEVYKTKQQTENSFSKFFSPLIQNKQKQRKMKVAYDIIQSSINCDHKAALNGFVDLYQEAYKRNVTIPIPADGEYFLASAPTLQSAKSVISSFFILEIKNSDKPSTVCITPTDIKPFLIQDYTKTIKTTKDCSMKHFKIEDLLCKTYKMVDAGTQTDNSDTRNAIYNVDLIDFSDSE